MLIIDLQHFQSIQKVPKTKDEMFHHYLSFQFLFVVKLMKDYLCFAFYKKYQLLL